MNNLKPDRNSNFTTLKPVDTIKKETSIVDELLQLSKKNRSYISNFSTRQDTMKNEDRQKSFETLNSTKLFPGKQKVSIKTTPRAASSVTT